MIEKIAALLRKLIPILILCCYHRLSRFLTNLLEYLVQTLIKKVTRVGALGPFLFSLLDQSVKPTQHFAQVPVALPGVACSLNYIVKARGLSGMTGRTGRSNL